MPDNLLIQYCVGNNVLYIILRGVRIMLVLVCRVVLLYYIHIWKGIPTGDIYGYVACMHAHPMDVFSLKLLLPMDIYKKKKCIKLLFNKHVMLTPVN